MLVNGVVEYRGVLFENVLGAVAVVDVGVNDAHPLDAVLHLQVAGGDGDIVEVAKPHGLVPLGMVAGRTDGAERVVQLTFHDPPGGVQYAPHRQISGFVSVHAHLVVGIVEGAVSGQTDLLEATDVFGVVDGFNPLEVGTNRRNEGQLVQQSGFLDAVVHRD